MNAALAVLLCRPDPVLARLPSHWPVSYSFSPDSQGYCAVLGARGVCVCKRFHLFAHEGAKLEVDLIQLTLGRFHFLSFVLLSHIAVIPAGFAVPVKLLGSAFLP